MPVTAYHHLQTKWTKRHHRVSERLWKKHGHLLKDVATLTKKFTIGSLSSLMLFAIPVHVPSIEQTFMKSVPADATLLPKIDSKTFLVSDLKTLLPTEMQPLSRSEEKQASEIIYRATHIHVAAELEGKRLNRSYGYIGAEQHLGRFPGDTIDSHFETDEDAQKFSRSGMAPGLGAYGYFAQSAQGMTKVESDREKYYIAVQTFLSPSFMERASEYNEFYKFRKMLVINPNTGRAVVVVIGDAGPAAWTGKHLGGSPEVMKYLERVDGRQRGAVLYFFITDPDDTIPLGPLEY